MSYWEFLIQRENDRAWRPLTSRNLQIFEGNYRIIANTSIINSAVRTQVFHQTTDQPPQLSQNHSQSTSNEGMLVVLPFTHLHTGTWHLNCNVTSTAADDVHEQLCLKVIPRPATADAAASPVEAVPSPAAASRDPYPDDIIAASVSDLDNLLSDLEPENLVPERADLPAAVAETETNEEFGALPAELTAIAEDDLLDLSVITVEEVPEDDIADPFAAALQIAMRQREEQQQDRMSIEQDQLQEILTINDLEFSILDPDDLPMNSYDINSYEVVVED
jgi:hypothetical protein